MQPSRVCWLLCEMASPHASPGLCQQLSGLLPDLPDNPGTFQKASQALRFYEMITLALNSVFIFLEMTLAVTLYLLHTPLASLLGAAFSMVSGPSLDVEWFPA